VVAAFRQLHKLAKGICKSQSMYGPKEHVSYRLSHFNVYHFCYASSNPVYLFSMLSSKLGDLETIFASKRNVKPLEKKKNK